MTSIFTSRSIIFQNGGAPRFGGNNYPLRGGKNTLWEGGVRSPTLVAGGRVQKKGSRHDGYVTVCMSIQSVCECEIYNCNFAYC